MSSSRTEQLVDLCLQEQLKFKVTMTGGCRVCAQMVAWLTELKNILGNNLQNDIHAWRSSTFPEQTPVELINRMSLEFQELMTATDEGRIEEAADVVIMLFGLAGLLDFDLLEEVRKKMAINKQRTWTTTEDGVVQHVEP